MKKVSITLKEDDLEKLKALFHSSSDDEAIQFAISHVLNQKNYDSLLELEGNVKWEGDLDEMRMGHQ